MTTRRKAVRRLEHTLSQGIERMEEVARDAEKQMNRGKEQLDRFIEHQAHDHELLRRVAQHLSIEPVDPPPSEPPPH